jgi:hypothetical protein
MRRKLTHNEFGGVENGKFILQEVITFLETEENELENVYKLTYDQ